MAITTTEVRTSCAGGWWPEIGQRALVGRGSADAWGACRGGEPDRVGRGGGRLPLLGGESASGRLCERLIVTTCRPPWKFLTVIAGMTVDGGRGRVASRLHARSVAAPRTCGPGHKFACQSHEGRARRRGKKLFSVTCQPCPCTSRADDTRCLAKRACVSRPGDWLRHAATVPMKLLRRGPSSTRQLQTDYKSMILQCNHWPLSYSWRHIGDPKTGSLGHPSRG